MRRSVVLRDGGDLWLKSKRATPNLEVAEDLHTLKVSRALREGGGRWLRTPGWCPVCVFGWDAILGLGALGRGSQH